MLLSLVYTVTELTIKHFDKKYEELKRSKYFQYFRGSTFDSEQINLEQGLQKVTLHEAVLSFTTLIPLIYN